MTQERDCSSRRLVVQVGFDRMDGIGWDGGMNKNRMKCGVDGVFPHVSRSGFRQPMAAKFDQSSVPRFWQ